MHGFKSFADRSIIEFKPGITGIVGPNGCGKSNINDAIRWVLGEQSVKSLRGSSMADVIFAGSEDRKAQNVAEVTLVFDNHDHYIDSEYEEIEITRRLYRDGQDAEYLLNQQHCRLKDIIDLLMDTGLGRDSLSIISQGNISSFADSKPEERRGMFEEAAGVAKYKKRKIESLRKLERTTENLNRIEDIVGELERQILPLRKQKEKAEKYLHYKEALENVEVTLIVKEVEVQNQKAEVLKQEIDKLELDIVEIQNSETLLQQENESQIEKLSSIDQSISNMQNELMKKMEEVTRLEGQKNELDAKRKYALNNTDNTDLQVKIENAKHIVQDLAMEYNDRVDRLNQGEKEIKDLETNYRILRDNLNVLNQKLNHVTVELQRSRAQKSSLQDQFENNLNYQAGVREILKSKDSIHGFQGVLGDMIEIVDGYQTAIQTSLGPASQYIVMKDQVSSRQAISFLKKNRAGRATFLPMDTMKPRFIHEDSLTVLESLPGYLGKASDFVTVEKKYQDVLLSQLGNIIIASSLKEANELSKMTYGRYRVVTLEGDVVNIGGSMTGGAYRKQDHHLNLKQAIESKTIEISSLEKEVMKFKSQLSICDNDERDLSNRLMQKKIQQGQLENIVKNKYNKFQEAKAMYESLTHKKLEIDELSDTKVDNELIVQLNDAIKARDYLTAEIREQHQLRILVQDKKTELDQELRILRRKILDDTQKQTQLKVEKTKIDSQLSISLQRLNEEYKMTYEYAKENYNDELELSRAREEVLNLRSLIRELGSVNVDSIEQYQSVSERYETLNAQKIDLQQAQYSILKAIDEMDKVVVEKFDETFKKINEEFNLVFRRLFGGGKANLKYSNPENILETGIDIDVQPPGKAVQNISLFSGGEKALIALSGLFAILRARPVPMCLLDEVEAALDQANVERFAKFLKDFSSKTQFIVVTHRPGTMEQCDALYGATMQEKGVTRLISVQLEDAKDLADEG